MFSSAAARLVVVRSQLSKANYSNGKGKYSNTCLLPKSNFTGHIAPEEEKLIINSAKFAGLYERQRKSRNEKEQFILHDGPPYANGPAHLGHAVNRIRKDLVVRYNLVKGNCVHYRPGWDCHGLPIELKASQDVDLVVKRKKSRQLALSVVEQQKATFTSWGICGDWANPYLTLDSDYVHKELCNFFQLNQAGLIFKGNLPVYWSIEHETSLAEAELEYVSDHQSPSVYVKFPLSKSLPGFDNLHALIWTTTPWTLPANEAICYAPNKEYAIISIEGDVHPLIVAAERIEHLAEELTGVSVVAKFSGEKLDHLTYFHPVGSREQLPFLQTDYVTMDKGTGLMHSAPNHGKEDYAVACKYKLSPKECLVDEKGRYTAKAGEKLALKHVLTDGTEAVLTEWAQAVVKKSKYIHSYPYDWRSKKPVIVRTSQQWFLDIESIKDDILRELESTKFYPEQLKTGLKNQIENRPPWCISRQRAWGVPIPVFYDEGDAENKNPIMDGEIISQTVSRLKEKSLDAWWSNPIGEFLPDNLKAMQCTLKKSMDILDIWFDSGTSWCTLPERTTAQLYLEGIDQIRGWFQSSLILSVALRNVAPYSSVLVHGFTLDGEGRKMSKSLGNVVDPAELINGNKKSKVPQFGVECLRFWVFLFTGSHGNVNFNLKQMNTAQEHVKKIRLTLKFILGCLDDEMDESDMVPVRQLRLWDTIFLCHLKKTCMQIENYIQNYNQVSASKMLCSLIDEDLSALYFASVKDRLYCSSKCSLERRSVQTVLLYTLHLITRLLSPVLPVTFEEAYPHYPPAARSKEGISVFENNFISPDKIHLFDGHGERGNLSGEEKYEEAFHLLLSLRESLLSKLGSGGHKKYLVTASLTEQLDTFRIIQVKQLFSPCEF